MRLARVAGIAVAVTAAFAVTAPAHFVQYSTSGLTAAYTGTEFTGSVSAQKKACRANRLVEVLADTPGVDTEVGRTKTDGAGEWRLPATSLAAADYYAQAERKTLKLTVDHRHVCKDARSATVPIAP